MSRQVKIAAVLVSIAAALVIGYLAYQHSQAHSREALLNKSAEMAQTGYYADAARLIDRALTLPGDGVRSDEMLYLKKADYLQKSGDTAEALSIAMRVVKTGRGSYRSVPKRASTESWPHFWKEASWNP